jgi:hypothetical protein
MIREHERAVLNIDLPDFGLVRGDLGTVVMVHRGGEAYEVEFMTLDGRTVEVVTLEGSQIRPVSHGEVAHVRPFMSPGIVGTRILGL